MTKKYIKNEFIHNNQKGRGITKIKRYSIKTRMFINTLREQNIMKNIAEPVHPKRS